MRVKFFLLMPKQRERIRGIARKAHIDNPGNQEAAIAQATADIQDQLVGSVIIAILLGVAIQLAIELIVYWIKQMWAEPPVEYQAGEPGNSDEEDNDDA